MNKQQAIEAFKADCLLPQNIEKKKFAIEKQYQSNTWEIFSKDTTRKIVILRVEFGKCQITVWSHSGTSEKASFKTYAISEEEYKKLEAAYFDFESFA